ncbi:uncharacterized protein JCM6883_001707 [Sporobolomyces salmoneus]|uniref:uncharacterized protein n=1 Tax=Sporobolomyces salmoneus TaxID=183962 RepID=UPI003180581D
MLIRLLCPLVSLLSSLVVASPTITGQILLTNQTVPLDISAQITLGGKNGYRRFGSIYGHEDPPEYHFSFPPSVPPVAGDYVLRIESRKYEFQSYFVRVGKDERVQVALFDEKFLKMVPGTWLPRPLVIHPLRLYPLKDPEPPSMSLVQLLKRNPLIWLLGLGLIFMLAIPKLMENLDPETLKEVRESQKEMHQNMASLQSFDSSKISKFLAGGGGNGNSEVDSELIPDLSTVKPKNANSSSSSTTGAARNGGGGGKTKKRK